ncbi:MAG TPA: LLM class flavin-dependent oxidoreductase [Pseudonocardia sp.]|jgi:alkanesulfonate monooxygenase SsuD/methylene tetrahydromethanopterin reductase-like flavin-dependent oxidoreductase (luciferase family)|nr:LLM class flavin-dependent oxidoreductase [Pseudonocardia sp.]
MGVRFGLYYDFRNPPDRRQDPARLYDGIIDQIARAEQLGWDDVWISEHHFCDDDYLPSVFPVAAAIAARTQRIRIGTSILILPFHDPVRTAEDAAVVDILSNGRLELGVGAGYRNEEFAGFGIDPKERAGRLNEALPLLRRLFAGETVTHEGKYYRYDNVSLRPLPVQGANLPLWSGGTTLAAIRRAARHCDGYLGLGPIGPMLPTYHEELRKAGKDPETAEVASALMWLLVSRDPEARWKEALPHLSDQITRYAKWTTDAGLDFFQPASDRAGLERQGCLIVTPEQACEVLTNFIGENKLTRFYSWTLPPGLPPEWSDEHVELFASEVIPNFR